MGDEMSKKIHTVIKSIIYILIMGVVLAVATLLRYTRFWGVATYGTVPFAQIVFHLRAPLASAATGLVKAYIKGYVKGYWWLALLLAAAVIVFRILYVRNTEGKPRLWKSLRNVSFGLAGGFALLELVILANTFGVKDYIRDQMNPSSIYEEYYVEAEDVEIAFPEEKQNLIYIYMESMEATYSDCENGGDMEDNLIPNLTELAYEGDDFTAGETLGGGYSATNSTWTIAAMVAQSSGTPLSVALDLNEHGSEINFLPGLTSLGDILEEEGYQQLILMGSGSTFGGRWNYYTSHGNVTVFDYFTAVNNGDIPEDYKVFWGLEDAKLYTYAQREILKLAENDEPFAVRILTVDTHFTDGYFCQLCENTYDTQMANVIACADRQVSAFVEWITEQDFYENTVIVIAGDHPNMDPVIEELMVEEDYERDVYYTILNSVPSRLGSYEETTRRFTTMDIFPTTLAAMGVTIEGDRLGLGTNLYSEVPTLIELMGREELNAELAKVSRYYDKYIVVDGK